MVMVIWIHYTIIKSVKNMAPHNRDNKGIELNNDMQQKYDRSKRYFHCNQWYQKEVTLILYDKTKGGCGG